MSNVTRYDSSYFNAERLRSIKKNNRIFVVFSTLGERESGPLRDKLIMLKPIYRVLIDEIFISHRRDDERLEPDATESGAVEIIPEIKIINCAAVVPPDMGDESGKGADMRRTLYTIAEELKSNEPDADPVVVFLDSDADINHFTEEYAVSLACAVIDGYDFAKAGFWREMGRAKKFTAQPLFSSIDHPALNNLSRLTYPLSGECAARLSFYLNIPFMQRYGIETSMLMDACAGGYEIADINLRIYDHHHRDDIGVQKIAFGVIRTFLIKCRELGLIEFKNGARVSDALRASFIDENGLLSEIDSDASEKIYKPLIDIIT